MTSKLILVAIASIAVAGCGETFQNAWEPPGEVDEGAASMMEGPGLFTGEDGELTVVSTDIWDSERRRRGGTPVFKQDD